MKLQLPILTLMSLAQILLKSQTQAVAIRNSNKFVNLGTMQTARHNGIMITYFLSTYELSHAEALQECRTIYSGRLVSIYTEDEDYFIRMKIEFANLGGNEHVWTAGKYIEGIGANRWEWVTTAKQFIYTNWANPHEDLSELCTSLKGISSLYKWHSRPCSDNYKFVCQLVLSV